MDRMDDYISRQTAIDAINKAFKRVFTWDGTSPLGEKVLKDVPSADVQQVVRCNDCKYFEPYGHYEGWCHAWSGMTVDDAFCSFGERKDGEQNETD